MACSIDSIGPKPDGGLIFCKHSSSHFNKCTILPFNHTILLRCICGRELMRNAMIIKKFFDICIFEFSAIITSDMLQSKIIFILSSLGK